MCCLKKCGSKVNEAHHVINNTPTDNTRPGYRKTYAGTKTIQVAFSMRKTRCSMISTNNYKCVVSEFGFLEFIKQDTNSRIPGSYFTKIICKILSYFPNIFRRCSGSSLIFLRSR